MKAHIYPISVPCKIGSYEVPVLFISSFVFKVYNTGFRICCPNTLVIGDVIPYHSQRKFYNTYFFL